MRKTKKIALFSLAAGLFLAAGSPAQQTPAATPKSTPATGTQSAPAAKTTKPAAKPGAAGATKTPAPLELKTEKDKVSYAIGLNIGKNLKRDSVEIEPSIISRGIKDGMSDAKPLMTDDEARATLTTLQGEVKSKEEAKAKLAAAENKKASDAFFAANKSKEGIVTLPSGLQYKVVKEGTGPKPTSSDVVLCHYRGALLDNTEFDNSYKRGEPLKIPVGQVIKGWTEALQLMPVGSKWQLFIPPDLAYGERGAPGSPIGPNAALMFDVELISIEPKDQPKPAAAAQPKEDAKPEAPAASQPKP